MKLSDRLDALFWRIYAAAGVFCLVAITVQLEPFLQYMAMCMFFALAIVPLMLIAGLVDLLREELTYRRWAKRLSEC